MVRIGLTGGIGAGKSTVSGRLTELGATVIDADRVAREVVAPGTKGLTRLVAEFGSEIMRADGSLDRPALAARAFADEASRVRLNAITHPLVGERTAELVAAAGPDAIVVQDIPLLVESGMAPLFALTVVVWVPAELRLRRLVESRGMDESDARSRMNAQATDAERRAAADVLLDNTGTPAELEARVDALWHERLVPYAENIAAGAVVDPAEMPPVDPDRTWSDQARRAAARLSVLLGGAAAGIEHVGPTARGERSSDVLDLRVLAADPEGAAAILAPAGYRPIPARTLPPSSLEDGPGAGHCPRLVLAGADPGRPLRILLDTP